MMLQATRPEIFPSKVLSSNVITMPVSSYSLSNEKIVEDQSIEPIAWKKDNRFIVEHFEKTIYKLIDLQNLQAGWDSYSASPIFTESIVNMVELLCNTFSLKTPEPYVIPISNGFIQFEWHQSGISLEIEDLGKNIFGISYEDESKAEYFELDLHNDASAICEIIKRLNNKYATP